MGATKTRSGGSYLSSMLQRWRVIDWMMTFMVYFCCCISPPAQSLVLQRASLWIPVTTMKATSPVRRVAGSHSLIFRLAMVGRQRESDVDHKSPPPSLLSRRRLLFLGTAAATGALLPSFRDNRDDAAQAFAGQDVWSMLDKGKDPAKEKEKGKVEGEKAPSGNAKQSPPKLRSELEDIKKELQADLQALEQQVEAVSIDTKKQLERYAEANDEDLSEQITAFDPLQESEILREWRETKRKIQRTIEQVDEAIIDAKRQEEFDAIRLSLEKKKDAVLDQLRAAKDKVRDPELNKRLQAVEKEVQRMKDPQDPRDWADMLADRSRDLRKFVGEKALENEDFLRQLDDALPFDIIGSKFEGDELYLTFPILGDVKVRKAVLSAQQVLEGGVYAGALGEVLKDVISYPLDTIRTRLMTQGSFTDKTTVTAVVGKAPTAEGALANAGGHAEGERSQVVAQAAVVADIGPAISDPSRSMGAETPKVEAGAGTKVVTVPKKNAGQNQLTARKVAAMQAISLSKFVVDSAKQLPGVGTVLVTSSRRVLSKGRQVLSLGKRALVQDVQALLKDKGTPLFKDKGTPLFKDKGTPLWKDKKSESSGASSLTPKGQGSLQLSEDAVTAAPAAPVKLSNNNDELTRAGDGTHLVHVARKSDEKQTLSAHAREGDTSVNVPHVTKSKESSKGLLETISDASRDIGQAVAARVERSSSLLPWPKAPTVQIRRGGRLAASLTRRLPFKVPAGLFNNVYSGAIPAFFFSPLQGAAFFGAKDYLYRVLPTLGLNSIQVFLVAVTISDAVYWLIRCPSETIKTRLQASVDPGPLQSFLNVKEQSGLAGFYKGYVPLMQLDIPFTAVNFGIYSTYKAFVTASSGHDPTATDLFIGGFFAAAFTAGITTPLNVASTRILMAGANNKQPDGDGEAVVTRRYETMWGTLQQVYKEEGFASLYRGVVPRVLQVGFNHALRFTGYEAARESVTKQMLIGAGDGHAFSFLFGDLLSMINDAVAHVSQTLT